MTTATPAAPIDHSHRTFALPAQAATHASLRRASSDPVETTARRLEALSRVDLFSVLAETDLRRLADALIERVYPAGATIVHADDPPGAHFFIVAEGEVAVVLESSEGKEAVLATLQAGDFFGEMSLLEEAPRAATARTAAPTRLLLLRREDFRRLLQDCKGMSMSLMNEMSRRLRQSNRKVAGLSYRPMQARVAMAVVGLMEDRGIRLRDGGARRVVIRNRPTQQFLAEMAGTTRESVSRTLALWAREGVLKARGREMTILEEDKLKALAG